MWPIIEQFVCAIIMMVYVLIFAKIVLGDNINISKLRLFGLLLVFSILHALIYLNLEGTPKTLIILLIDIFFYKLVFKTTNQQAIFLNFLHMIILIVPDFLELLFVTNVLGLSKEFCYNYLSGSPLSNFIICSSSILITCFFKKPFRKLIEYKIENNAKIVIFALLTLTCILVIFYRAFTNIIIDENLIISIFCMLVFAIVLFSLMRQTIKNNKITSEYDQLLEIMKTYEYEIENQRTLRHESRNELLAIKAKIQDKQGNEEILKYINELLSDKIEVKQEQYAKFGYLPANGIKGLCYFKAQEAENKGIKLSLNISPKIEKSSIYQLDVKQQREFGRILGVFLDNAIEASQASEDKKLGIEAYVNRNKEFRMIISNSYSNDIDKTKIGRESFSTKGKGRGHGLLLVRRITDNNQIFETETNIQEKIYSQTVIIRNINNGK